MLLAVIAVSVCCVFGHAAVWIFVANRLHATGWPRWFVSTFTRLAELLVLLGPLALMAWLAWGNGARFLDTEAVTLPWWAVGYVAVCCLVALIPLPMSWWRRTHPLVPDALLSNHTTRLNLRRQLGDDLAGASLWRMAVYFPGNESLRLDVNEKRLRVPRLDPALEGLSIAHLSDLHFSGKIAPRFFEEVIERTNQLKADLVAFTGDLIDHRKCIPWIDHIFSRLRVPPGGAYFVLGNHDRRFDAARIRRELSAAGLKDMGGQCHGLEINGRAILLAGSEMPWFPPAPNLAEHALKNETRDDDGPILRILLSHSPDQIGWARRHGFDLMLAGHTHGGQIRLPLIGPVVAPSRYGVKYASGTFHEPPTLMHVSRGISGKTPLRFGCPPELTRLVLTR